MDFGPFLFYFTSSRWALRPVMNNTKNNMKQKKTKGLLPSRTWSVTFAEAKLEGRHWYLPESSGVGWKMVRRLKMVPGTNRIMSVAAQYPTNYLTWFENFLLFNFQSCIAFLVKEKKICQQQGMTLNKTWKKKKTDGAHLEVKRLI